MFRLFAFLKWYDESPAALADVVRSVAFCDHLVAVDGAYALFPDGRRSSPREQHVALINAAADYGLPLTLHVPETVWRGNEIDKLGLTLRLVRQLARRGTDWTFGIDADERVTDLDEDALRAALASTEHDVAQCWLHGTGPDDQTFGYPIRRLFRVLPRLSVRGAHHLVTGLHERERVWLGTHPDPAQTAAVLDVSSLLRLEHLNRGTSNDVRSPERVAAQIGYYNAREQAGVERLTRWR